MKAKPTNDVGHASSVKVALIFYAVMLIGSAFLAAYLGIFAAA